MFLFIIRCCHLVDMLSAQNRLLTSNHDANVPFGIEVPWGHRKIFIQRHTFYLKIQDGCRWPSWKMLLIISEAPFIKICIMMHVFQLI